MEMALLMMAWIIELTWLMKMGIAGKKGGKKLKKKKKIRVNVVL